MTRPPGGDDVGDQGPLFKNHRPRTSQVTHAEYPPGCFPVGVEEAVNELSFPCGQR